MRHDPDGVMSDGVRHRTLVGAPARVAATGPDGRPRFRLVLSTEDVARDGDIIRADGWDIDEFAQNPVVLWSHSGTDGPIGRMVDGPHVRGPKSARRLDGTVEFARESEGSPMGERVEQLVTSGFLRAVSVGFVPMEREDVTDEQRVQLGLGPWGSVWSRVQLLEVSMCCVGADAGALVSDGRIAEAAYRSLAGPSDDRAEIVAELLRWLDEPPGPVDELAIELVSPSTERMLADLVRTLPGVVASEVESRIERLLARERTRAPARPRPRETAPNAPAFGIADTIRSLLED